MNGQTFVLRPSFSAIDDWEEATGLGTLALAVAATRQQLKAAHLVEVVRASSAAGGNALGPDQIRDIAESKGLWHLIMPVTELLNNALMGGSEPSGEGPAAEETTQSPSAA